MRSDFCQDRYQILGEAEERNRELENKFKEIIHNADQRDKNKGNLRGKTWREDLPDSLARIPEGRLVNEGNFQRQWLRVFQI